MIEVLAMAKGTCAQCGVAVSRKWAKRGICRHCAAQGPGGQGMSAGHDDSEDKLWDYLFSKWWGHWLFALVFFGCAWLVFDHISTHEQTGHAGRIWWLVALVYAIAGKGGATLVFAIPAVVFTFTGLVKLGQPADKA